MRRKEREVSDVKEIAQILSNCSTLRIAFPTPEAPPYVVPVIFGFSLQNDRFALFFHSAAAGRKVELIESGDVCKIGWETDRTIKIGALENANVPCAWSCRYESVIGTGVIARLEGKEKTDGLSRIMEHYQFPGKPQFDEKILARTNVYRIDVTSISAKRH